MNKGYIIPMVIGVFALLFIAGAFATEASAAYVQAVQLQLNLDKAITVGTAAVAQANANATGNLSAQLNQLIALRASIDANDTTIDQVQAQRKQAMDIVTAFRKTAQATLTVQQREQINAQANAAFQAKHQAALDMVKELRKEINTKQLDSFTQAQQQVALGLNASDNVSIVPELAAKIADIRNKIEADDVSHDEIAQLRTQIKANVESLKANRSQMVAQIRAAQLKVRVDVEEQLIANATAANVSTTDLQTSHDAMVSLLGTYASGNITADAFVSQAKDLLEQSTHSIASPAYAHFRGGAMRIAMSERVEVRNESKEDWMQWKNDRDQMMMQINLTHGNIKDLREQMMANRTQSRDDLREIAQAVRQNGSDRLPRMMNGGGRDDASASVNTGASAQSDEDVSASGSASVSVTG